MKVESTSADRGIKHISLSVLFTYFTVFVFHPAFMLLGLASLTPTGKSIGLVSMAERAREFGGSLSVQPGAAGGACLCLDLPLEDAP